GPGAVGVAALAIVNEAQDAQTIVIPAGKLSGRHNRIGALHAEDEAERCGVGPIRRPLVDVALECGGILYESDVAVRIELLIVGELSPGDGERDFWCAKVEVG